MVNWQNQYQGLSQEEAVRRLAKYGLNKLAEKRRFSVINLLLSQFTSPMIYILLAAMAVTVVLGDYVDAVVIGLAVLVNTLLGFWQEFKAERGLEKLSAVLTRQVMVLRDGERVKMEVAELVPGDVVFFEAGESMPADGVVVEAHELSVSEAILTGESVPLEKRAAKMKRKTPVEGGVEFFEKIFTPIEKRKGEARKSVYAGSMVMRGTGVMVVVATGKRSEVGKIADSLADTEDEATPLQKQLTVFSGKLAVLVGVLALGIFVVGILMGGGFTEIFTFSVAVAVSAIPEGLVVALTAILAIGMQRILKRKALVRKLVAAEVLGSVSVICTDKTGTITEGELQVAEAVLVDRELGLAALLSASDLKDPMEVAMYEWAQREAGEGKAESLMNKYMRIDRLPFSSERKFSATLTKKELFVVGAPELLLSKARMSQKERNKWLEQIETKASRGYRLVGVVHRKRKDEQKIGKEILNESWYWLGYVVYKDQVRKGVKKVFAEAQRAGMKIKVITGDYRETAVYVMKELGLNIEDDEIMDGAELEGIDAHDLDQRMNKVRLFARTSPAQKLKIVESLLRQGEVVAMTGDGVNDAPALKKADIGVVVSSASDVSKETADLVLLHDDFSTVIAAVEEGRGIFENFRKVLLYLMSDSFTEVIIVIGAVMIALVTGSELVLPITAAQILWVNLANDGLPSLALTMEPKDEGLLKRKPRDAKAHIIDQEIGWLIVLISLTTGILVLVGFIWQLWQGASLEYAQTFAFALLGVDSLLYVFSARTLRTPIWKDNIFKNPWLIGAVAAGFLIQLAAIYLPVLQKFLGTVPLGLNDWGIILVFSAIVIAVIEVVKAVFMKSKVGE